METVPNEYVILISSKILGNSKFKLVQESDVAAVFSSQIFLNFGTVAFSLLFVN